MVLNDKGRPYRVAPTYGSEYGVFTGVTVEERQRVSRGGTGLFELGVRDSAIDLESREVRGGVEHDFTAGVNWYPEPNIRFVFDSIRSHAGPSAESLNFGRRTVDATSSSAGRSSTGKRLPRLSRAPAGSTCIRVPPLP